MFPFMNKKKFLTENVLKTGKTLERELTSAQKKTWHNVKRGFIELKMAEEGKLKFRPIQELINEP